MYILIVGSLLLIAFGTFAWEFMSRMRTIRAAESSATPTISTDRYRPMLRLLSDEDLSFVSASAHLRKTLRSRRRELFRGYLNCLTRDYARLLGGVREVMVQAGIDRPDLAKALAKNRVFFAMAICRVEYRLALHAIGVGTVDVSALVEAMETLSSQVRAFTAAPAMVAAS
jgi:hypothetical protein